MVGPQATWEYRRAIAVRYRQADRRVKGQILDEFCEVTGHHRKAAIRMLRVPLERARPRRGRGRRAKYSGRTLEVLAAIWTAAGYPWSLRLKALLPAWLPWARQRFQLTATVEAELRQISPRQMDRRLQAQKRQLAKRLYGRTKPGTLLKHHIPIQTEHWSVTTPGFTEIDLVSHSGDCADGEFLHSLNVTDIHTTWVETRAVMGKGQAGVQQALDTLRAALPFRLRGIDSDNGSEFINHHLYRYCQAQEIQFTRGRPYKKDDNAHIEQKNWTHVRKLVGYVRYDSPAALAALNQLYDDLRLFQNLWLPSVKLVTKTRVGSRLRRQYDAPQTPLDRVRACPDADGAKVAALDQIWRSLDPFALGDRIDQQLTRLYALANHRQSPAAARPMAAVENVKNTFPTAPTGPPVLRQTQKTPVTGLTAR